MNTERRGVSASSALPRRESEAERQRVTTKRASGAPRPARFRSELEKTEGDEEARGGLPASRPYSGGPRQVATFIVQKILLDDSGLAVTPPPLRSRAPLPSLAPVQGRAGQGGGGAGGGVMEGEWVEKERKRSSCCSLSLSIYLSIYLSLSLSLSALKHEDRTSRGDRVPISPPPPPAYSPYSRLYPLPPIPSPRSSLFPCSLLLCLPPPPSSCCSPFLFAILASRASKSPPPHPSPSAFLPIVLVNRIRNRGDRETK